MLALSGYNDFDVDPRSSHRDGLGDAPKVAALSAAAGAPSRRRALWRRLFVPRNSINEKEEDQTHIAATNSAGVLTGGSKSSCSSSSNGIVDLDVLTGLAEELGVVLKEGAAAEGAAATAMWLFDGSVLY